MYSPVQETHKAVSTPVAWMPSDMKVLLAQFERVFHAFKGDASRDAKTRKKKIPLKWL